MKKQSGGSVRSGGDPCGTLSYEHQRTGSYPFDATVVDDKRPGGDDRHGMERKRQHAIGARIGFQCLRGFWEQHSMPHV